MEEQSSVRHSEDRGKLWKLLKPSKCYVQVAHKNLASPRLAFLVISESCLNVGLSRKKKNQLTHGSETGLECAAE